MTPAAAGDRTETIAAAVSKLLDEGLAHVQISARLGLTAVEVKEAVREVRRPDHGLPERWYRGCRCPECTDAVRKDPLVRQVGALRDDGLTYHQIAEQLSIPTHQAEAAAHASGVKKGIPHGRAARWRAGCRCEACTEAGHNETLAAKLRTDRQNGLVKNRLGNGLVKNRLGNGLVKRRIHGTPVQWRAGCRCQACVTAIRQDPLVIQVAELRNTGRGYKDIAAQLEISVAKAQEAGIAAGFQGPVGGPTSVAPPQCSWPACDSPALTGVVCAFHKDWAKRGFDPDNPATKDDFPSELRAVIILKAVELLISGLSYANVGKRLGITARITETLCRDAGFTAAPRREEATKNSAVLWRRGEEWDRLVASAGELLAEGLTTSEIAERLGVNRAVATNACRSSGVVSSVHGVPAKWHDGCRCDTCLEAMGSDPLITAVAERRSRNITYKDIAAEFGTTLVKVRQAGKEAKDCGLLDGFRRDKSLCAWPECGSPAWETTYCAFHEDRVSRGIPLDAPVPTRPPENVPGDGFTSESWAELVDAIRKLRESGLRDATIGRRLGVSTRVVKTAGKDAGVVGSTDGHADEDAGVQPADQNPLSDVALAEDGVGWIPLDTYVELTAPEDVTPEVHVRTPEEWAELVQSVGELRQAGLSIKKISLRLGITPTTATDACDESSFDGIPARPPHGTRSRWKTGCSCVLCTEGKEADPLIAEVRKLRSERMSYPKIAKTLGISPARAWQAGKDAGFTGFPERPADEPSASVKQSAQRAEDRAGARAHFQLWTEADERTVLSSDLGPKELAAKLGRTPASISNKRKELAANGGKPRTKRLRRPWSTEDDEVVMREDLTLQEKEDKVGRPYASVSSRGRLLRNAGAPKPAAAADKPVEHKRRPWTPEDLATARRGDVPVKELAAMLGRSPASVYGVRHRT